MVTEMVLVAKPPEYLNFLFGRGAFDINIGVGCERPCNLYEIYTNAVQGLLLSQVVVVMLMEGRRAVASGDALTVYAIACCLVPRNKYLFSFS